jgi:hypothetical protein
VAVRAQRLDVPLHRGLVPHRMVYVRAEDQRPRDGSMEVALALVMTRISAASSVRSVVRYDGRPRTTRPNDQISLRIQLRAQILTAKHTDNLGI